MKVIFAQGNPGSEYAGTRHNVGFIVIDALAKKHGVSFSTKPKFNAEIAEFTASDEKVLLVKPTTFYNETGRAARALVDFYKLAPLNDLLVIHDDLALPFGSIRIRKKGSDAGNNGIKSLNAHLGQGYTRIRVGIGIAERTSDDSTFVLGRFNSEEAKLLKEEIIPRTHSLIDDFLATRLIETSHKV